MSTTYTEYVTPNGQIAQLRGHWAEQERTLTRAASAPAFAAIWDNPDDADYDAV